MEKFQTWRFFRYKEKHNSHCFAVRSVLLPCMLFCRKICSFEIYAVLLQNLFLRTFDAEKNLAKNVVHGEKMTNIMYGKLMCLISLFTALTLGLAEARLNAASMDFVQKFFSSLLRF